MNYPPAFAAALENLRQRRQPDIAVPTYLEPYGPMKPAWHDRRATDGSGYVPAPDCYNPTAEQIKAECAEIRFDWELHDFDNRSVLEITEIEVWSVLQWWMNHPAHQQFA